MKTLLSSALVVLAAVGIWMYSKHARQQEFALRNLEIQQKMARHRDRIDSLCTASQQATFERASSAELAGAAKGMQEFVLRLDTASPNIDHKELQKFVDCELEYRALIDDKVREQQLRKEYEQ